jgi:predicted TIM-barrel enzyme
MSFSRRDMLKRLRSESDARRPILVCSVGSGMAAGTADAGGADLVSIDATGKFRTAGWSPLAGLLPFGDANGIMLELAAQVLPAVKRVPVLAGVCASDPFRLMPQFLQKLQSMDFSGVQNYPSVGLIDGNFRQNLEKAGLGYDREIELIRTAHEMELFTAAYVFDIRQAEEMTDAGADMLVAHTGLEEMVSPQVDMDGAIDGAAEKVLAVTEVARKLRRDILVVCHGGPLNEIEDVEQALARMPGINGFLGASSIDNLPGKRAIRAQVESLKNLRLAA